MSLTPTEDNSFSSKRIIKWTSLVVLIGLVGSCAWKVFKIANDLELFSKAPERGSVSRVWTEDVLLDDGSTIQIKRTVDLFISDSWTHEAYDATETNATITFLGSLSNLPTWRAPRMALVLYQDKSTKEWVIVTTSTSCEIWEKNGHPKPNYWEYRSDDRTWREVPLSSSSFDRRANLFIDYNVPIEKDYLSVEDKGQISSKRRTARKYREIWSDPDMYICGEGNPNRVN